MNIVAELSLYPLRDDAEGPIESFIRALRARPGLQVRTNQLSTQVAGEFEAVTDAVAACLRRAMDADGRVVLVAKYLNANLDIDQEPLID